MPARLKRLEVGWNQHLPGLLDSVSLALGEARAAGQVHDRIDAVREELDRLTSRLDLTLAEFGARLATADRSSGGLDDSADRQVVSEAGAQTGRLDLQLARRPFSSEDRFTVRVTGTTGADLILDTDTGSPFVPGTVRSIVAATDFPLPEGQELEAVLRSWLHLLEPGGVCVVERFYVSDLLDDLAAQRLDMKDARSLAEARTPSHPNVSANHVANAMRSCGFDQVEVGRDQNHDVIVRGTRSPSGPAA